MKVLVRHRGFGFRALLRSTPRETAPGFFSRLGKEVTPSAAAPVRSILHAVIVALLVTVPLPCFADALGAIGQPQGQGSHARSPWSKSLGNRSSSPQQEQFSGDGISTPQWHSASVRARMNENAVSPSLRKLKLEPVLLDREQGQVSLRAMPVLSATLAGRFAGVTPQHEFVFFTIDPTLQATVRKLIAEAKNPHVAVVVMDPTSGRVLAMADKSPTIPNLVLHSDFPAASLFKLVTSAAALEQGKMSPLTTVWFRGGTYTLNRYNYLPDKKRDRQSMSASEALGRSCNPVFARIALRFLDQRVIESYAEHFGFNADLPFDIPLEQSEANIPGDNYSFSRTAAGFGDVRLSPVHAAALMSAIANDGIMPRPFVVDRVLNSSGEILFRSRPEAVQPVISAATSRRLRDMMEYTTTIGTSKREFMLKNRPILGKIRVAAKTGTLTGSNPKGLTNWFIAAAPKENPQIALAVIVVDPKGISTRASHIGRQIFEAYFKR